MNKKLSVALSVLMLSANISTVCAAPVTTTITKPGNQATDVQATIAQTKFNVTVPTGLPVNIDEMGVITVSDKAKIVNNSVAPIQVDCIKATPTTGYTLASYTTDFPKTYKINDKHIALQINNSNINEKRV